MSRPVVLIHGMWCTGAHWARIADGLRPRGFACHVPTLPAHEAGSADEVGNKSLAEYLSFLEDYVRRQNFSEPPILIGHSMGGLLAQQLAARIQPFALVLLTPAWPRGVFGVRPSNFIAFFRAVMRWGFWRKPQKPSFARAVTSAFNASVPPEKHRPLYAQLVEESGRVIVEIAFWMFDRARASAVDPAAVRCPVYVVSCGEDRLTPTGPVRSTAALYPQASLRHYPDRGHWVLDDIETDEMTAEIANWLKGHEQRAAARARG